MMYAQALTAFGRKIGIARSEFSETATECILTCDVLASTLKSISEQDILDLVAAFGESLTLWIGLAEGPRLIEIEEGEMQGDLGAALGKIEQSADSLRLRVNLNIDKTSIFEQQSLTKLPCHALCYIFADNLLRLLKSPLPDLDQSLFSSRDRSTLVFVSDADLHYAGHLLTLVGPKDIAHVQTGAKPLAASLRSRLDKYQTTAREHLSWQGFQFKHLTPIHFICERRGDGIDDFDSILADHTLHLCILYTANRSAYNGEDFDATYAGSEEVAELSLLSGVPIPARENLLSRLALWPQGGGERDTNRLTLFQNTVARELAGDSPRENYLEFIKRLRGILGEARWHHRVFVDQQIDKHFEQVEKVTDYVASVIKT